MTQATFCWKPKSFGESCQYGRARKLGSKWEPHTNMAAPCVYACRSHQTSNKQMTNKQQVCEAGVNILPKEQFFSPMLPSCDHKVSPFLPQFCDYMRGSVATKPLTAWGPGARLRAPGGVQGQSPWWGSRGQCPRKLQGFSQFNILRNSLQRALS